MQDAHNAPEVVVTPAEMNAPEAVTIHAENIAPGLAVASDTYKNAVPYQGQSMSECSQHSTVYDALQLNSPQVDSQSTSTPFENKERKMCGLRRRNFVILAIVVLILVAAGVGGGVGGAMAARYVPPDRVLLFRYNRVQVLLTNPL